MRLNGEPADDVAALGGAELDRLFAALEGAAAVIAAVSGGPDSIALMHLLARWRSTGTRPPVVVATVDHGLRPGAAQEAAFVLGEAVRLGLSGHVLTWEGPKPTAGVQEAARSARYRLLLGLARREGASHLATAHTLDDQAETILMRLARGSGLSGLAGMRPVTAREGLSHVRPFLGLRKDALLALCRGQGWSFVEDPSNADERFARVRWRKLMPLLAAEGLTAERLARLGERVSQAEEALQAKARDALARARVGARVGAGPADLRLAAAVLAEEPFEIAVRVLALALAELGRTSEPIRLQRLETCVEHLRRAARSRTRLKRTIAGNVVSLDRDGSVLIAPEPRRHRGRYLSDDH